MKERLYLLITKSVRGLAVKLYQIQWGDSGEIITIWGNQENVYREFMVKIGLEREVIIAQKDNASGRLSIQGLANHNS